MTGTDTAARMARAEVTTLMVPHQLQRTGVRRGLLEDLALKILYLHGEMSLLEMSERTCLSLGVIEEIFQFFRKEQLCEVKRMAAGSHVIVASGQGKQRAAELMAINQYTGPAPVSLADYTMRVGMQSVQRIALKPADISRAFYQLVLDQEMLTRIGTALVSGTSMFLHGPSGTGKTRSSWITRSYPSTTRACIFRVRWTSLESQTGAGFCAGGRAC